MEAPWRITFVVHRQKSSKPAYFDRFTIDVDPNEYVLDGLERIWAFDDRSLTFSHACHHSVCGACGMRVNGTEKLTCITPIEQVCSNGGTLKIEPLRNFPVVSDLVVDMGVFYRHLDWIGFKQVVSISDTPFDKGITPAGADRDQNMMRLVDCIECGLCISACPILGTTGNYLGPAVLAAVQHQNPDPSSQLFELVDHEDGVWRCHAVHECTEVCPSNVEPAWRIMDLRKQIIINRFKQLFRRQRTRS